MTAVQPNHFRDQVVRLRQIADGLRRRYPEAEKSSDTGLKQQLGTRSAALDRAADVLETLPCEHEAESRRTDDDRLTWSCLHCAAPMKRVWVVDEAAEDERP